MATKIVTKNSSTASAVPTASDLVQGELAVNVADKRLFTEDNGGSIVELGTNPYNFTANHNGSAKLATTSTGIDVTGRAVVGSGSFDGGGVIHNYGSDGNSRSWWTKTDTHGYGDFAIRQSTTQTGSTYQTRLLIDTSGNVGIGTSSPNSYTGQTTLNINSTGVARLDLDIGDTMQGYLLAESGYTGLFTPSGSNSLRFGTNNTERMRIESAGTVKISHADTASEGLRVIQTTAGRTSGGALALIYDDQAGTTQPTLAVQQNGTGDILQLFDGGSQAVTVKDGGNVGIGEADPDSTLTVKGASHTNFQVKSNSESTKAFIQTVQDSDVRIGSSTNHPVSLYQNGTERMRIDSSGNVGIGVSNPSSYYTNFNELVLGNTSTHSGMTIASGTTHDGTISFADGTSGSDLYQGYIQYNHEVSSLTFGTSAASRMAIDASGNITATTSGTAMKAPLLQATNGNVATYAGTTPTLHSPASATLAFSMGGGERMRIDSSGNLLVGKTSTSGGIAGTVLAASGLTRLTASGIAVAEINRLSSDGSIVDFKKNGATIGDIGVNNNDNLRIQGNSSHCGLEFGTNAIYPHKNSANVDNQIDLGESGLRYKDLYRAGSTYSTSDRNMKQDIRDLTDAERNVALACKGLLKAFRFIDTVEKDGDNANIHFGVIAQELAEAFEAEGLDANHYQVYKSATYTDESDVEQTRLNVCYENLLAFIIAAI